MKKALSEWNKSVVHRLTLHRKTEREIKEEANIRIVRQAFEALNSGDTSRNHEYISPDYFNHESQVDLVRSKMRGAEEFRDTVKNLRSAFPDLHYEELEVFASKDMVVSTLCVTGEHLGNFFFIPPTGRKIAYQAVHMHRISNDGRIVEHKAIRDDLTLTMQLGLVGLTSIQYEALFRAWKGLESSEITRSEVNESSVEEDKAAISMLYFQMINGWNKASGSIFASPFAEDGDLVGFDGTHLKGRQNIGHFHQQLFNTDNPNAGQWFITAFQNTRVQYIGRPQEIQTLTEELRKEFGQ